MSKSIVLKMRSNRLSRTSIVFLGSKCMSSTISYRVVERVKQNTFPISHSPWSALSCNHFSSSAGSNDKKEEPDTETYLLKWIRAFNETTTVNPDLSLYSFMIMRLVTWYMLAGVGSFVLDLGPELAVGYLAARFTGNFRQPFNLGLAALISAECPVFSTIKSSALMGIITRTPLKDEKPPQMVKFEIFIKRISGPMDKYGFSYFVASRINLALLICGVSYGVQTGLDVRNPVKTIIPSTYFQQEWMGILK